MSKRNLRNAAKLAQAIAVLHEFHWTWIARVICKRIAKKLIARGIN